MINRSQYGLFAGSLDQYSALAIELVRSSTVIDMLGLITLDFPKVWGWQANPQTFQKTEFDKIRASGTTVFHPAVGFNSGDIHAESLKDLQGWNRLITAHPEYFSRICCMDDLEGIKASGKIGILLGEQNSAHFRTVDDVDAFYKLGQRVSQLTYYRNRLGYGSTDAVDSGLSEFGLEILGRMNK